MARRQDHNPEQLQQLVISTVVSQLQSQAASELSLRSIAKTVGYSPGTLINLFGSYARLLLVVNAHSLDLLSERLQQAMQQLPGDADHSDASQLSLLESADDSTAHTPQQPTSNINPALQLQVFGQQYLAFARQHPHQWRLIFEHRLDVGDDIPDWQQSRINQLFALLEEALARLNPLASLAQCQQAAREIWAAVHGVCVLELEDKLFMPLDSCISTDDKQSGVRGGQMVSSLLSHYLASWQQQIEQQQADQQIHHLVQNLKNEQGISQ